MVGWILEGIIAERRTLVRGRRARKISWSCAGEITPWSGKGCWRTANGPWGPAACPRLHREWSTTGCVRRWAGLSRRRTARRNGPAEVRGRRRHVGPRSGLAPIGLITCVSWRRWRIGVVRNGCFCGSLAGDCGPVRRRTWGVGRGRLGWLLTATAEHCRGATQYQHQEPFFSLHGGIPLTQ